MAAIRLHPLEMKERPRVEACQTLVFRRAQDSYPTVIYDRRILRCGGKARARPDALKPDPLLPMFRDAFKSKRCLIPASGYYEWHDAPGGKQPYYFTRRDGQPITFAGLWSSWKDREADNKLLSCTMLITEPNKFVAEVHDRIPVILETKDFEQWEHGDTKDAAA
jgi:hypothetical protein